MEAVAHTETCGWVAISRMGLEFQEQGGSGAQAEERCTGEIGGKCDKI